MNRWLLNHLPTWAIMLLFVTGALLFAYIVFRAVRRWFVEVGAGEQNEVATLSVEIIGAVYGIILGFIIVALWEGFDAADNNVSAEATALAQVSRSAAVFAPDARTAIQTALGRYVHAVTDDEWPKMREGETSAVAAQAMDDLYTALERYEPQTETQKVFYQQAVSHVDTALAARRVRLDRVNSTLPGAIQFMMYAGFVAIVTFMAAVGSSHRRAQMVMLLGVTAVVAFNLVLAATLDYPFSGDVSVGSEPFRQGALAQFYTP